MAKDRLRDEEELKDAAADIVARGQRVRERVRDLVVDTMHGRMLPPNKLQSVVQEVMGGAIEALEEAVPADRSSSLRQVMTGVGDGFAVVGAGARRAAKSVSDHGHDLEHDMIPKLQKATADATRQVLSAMSRFSRKLSGSVRDEIETLVAETRRTGLDLAPVLKKTGRAAAKDPAELARESMQTGLRLAGTTAAQLMSATGGLLSGIGDAVAEVTGEAGRERSRSRKASGSRKDASSTREASAASRKKKAGTKTGKKAGKKTGKKAGKKTVAKKAAKKATKKSGAASGSRTARVKKAAGAKGSARRGATTGTKKSSTTSRSRKTRASKASGKPRAASAAGRKSSASRSATKGSARKSPKGRSSR